MALKETCAKTPILQYTYRMVLTLGLVLPIPSYFCNTTYQDELLQPSHWIFYYIKSPIPDRCKRQNQQKRQKSEKTELTEKGVMSVRVYKKMSCI